jgi:hypothetical protein
MNLKKWFFMCDYTFSVLAVLWSALIYKSDKDLAIYLVLIAIWFAIHALIAKHCADNETKTQKGGGE